MAVSRIRIEETIQSENTTKGNVAVVKVVNYSDLTDKDLRRLWELYKDNIEGQFNENKWIIPSNLKDTSRHIFFPEDRKMAKIFKSFYLVRLSQGVLPITEASRMCEVIHFLQDTNYLSDDMLQFVEDAPYEYINNALFQSELLMFLDFASIEKPQYRLLIKALSYSSKSRIIPSFTSVLKFDNVIKRYIQEKGDKKLFDAVILWWELTKVLPIRPIEFFTLKKDCLVKQGDEYFIKIKRAKLTYWHSETPQVPLLDKLKVSKHIYDLFFDFMQKQSKILESNEYIFNTDWYKQFVLNSRLVRDGFVGHQEMYSIFNKFYDEIVANKFKYLVVEKKNCIELADNEIEKIQYGDTRHLAFINMILQGISPYTIAQIGGHTRINQQITYYTHLEPYLSSKAYCLSRNIIDGFADISYGFGYTAKKKTSIIKSTIQKDKLGDFQKIEGGYCTSSNIPYDCHYDECVFCPHSIITDEVDYISRNKEKLKNQLITDIEYLKEIISSNNCSDEEVKKTTLLNSINSTTSKLAVLYSKENDAKEI